jgi:hypothetical protein
LKNISFICIGILPVDEIPVGFNKLKVHFSEEACEISEKFKIITSKIRQQTSNGLFHHQYCLYQICGLYPNVRSM